MSLCSRKDTSKEESSVDMKIFIGLQDLHAELPGLTMLDFFLSVTSVTRFGKYPVIHMQSTNMVKVKTAITRRQTYWAMLLQEGRRIGLFQKISTHTPYGRHRIEYPKFQDSQEGLQQLMQDSKCCGIPEFCKTCMNFREFRSKFQNFGGNSWNSSRAHGAFITGFPMSSGGGWIFSGMAQFARFIMIQNAFYFIKDGRRKCVCQCVPYFDNE